MAGSVLRKMLVISPEQLSRMRGEAIGNLKKELEGEMKKTLKHSEKSVKNRDVENMYHDWDEYRTLLQKYIDVKREERQQNVKIPIYEVGEEKRRIDLPVMRKEIVKNESSAAAPANAGGSVAAGPRMAKATHKSEE